MAAAKKSASRSKRAPQKPTAATKLRELKENAHVVSVFGDFYSRVLIEIPTSVANLIFQPPLENLRQTSVIEAVERDLAAIRERAPEVADSAVAATAVRLAYELEHPYNSATSKSMCARSLIQAIEHLRELAPEDDDGEGDDALDAIRDRVASRSPGEPAAKD